MLTRASVAIIFALATLPFATYSQQSFPAKYDNQFKSATSTYMPGVDWLLLKAQCYQESKLKEYAQSPAGAKGVCQFMPATWRQVSKEMGFYGSIFYPELNINAAAYYMAKMRNQWTTKRPEFDRHSLALASYNAGLGNLLKAQKMCDMAILYGEIIDCLPLVTGEHSKETIGYVSNIWHYWLEMKL